MGKGNGALMDLNDRRLHLHVAGYGNIGQQHGIGIRLTRRLSPRIGAAYQIES